MTVILTEPLILTKPPSCADISTVLWQAYLASSSEEESAGEQDAAALRDRYRSLLLDNTKGEEARTGGPKGRTWGGAASGSDQDSDSEGAGSGGEEAEV